MPFENRDASGELARSALSVTGERGVPWGVQGRWSSSFTVDCLFLSRSSSSSSSVISTNRLRRSELVDEDVEPDAACNEHAAESLVSLSSLASVISKMVS